MWQCPRSPNTTDLSFNKIWWQYLHINLKWGYTTRSIIPQTVYNIKCNVTFGRNINLTAHKIWRCFPRLLEKAEKYIPVFLVSDKTAHDPGPDCQQITSIFAGEVMLSCIHLPNCSCGQRLLALKVRLKRYQHPLHNTSQISCINSSYPVKWDITFTSPSILRLPASTTLSRQ